ncbi:hypothetical protein MAL04_06090 [Leptospira noguchii]|nr:hypothetical protein MAL04_06090 [Leptospira noguchii]
MNLKERVKVKRLSVYFFYVVLDSSFAFESVSKHKKFRKTKLFLEVSGEIFKNPCFVEVRKTPLCAE